MSKTTFLAFIFLAVVGAVICYFEYKQGERAGQEMTKQQYQNMVTDLQRSIDSLTGERKKLVDSAMNVQLAIEGLNEKNDSLISKLYNLNYQHKLLKQQYAKISHYDTLRRSDILRYVTDSVTGPVR